MPTLVETPITKLDVAPPYQLVQSRHGWMLCNLNDFYMGKAIATYGECCEIESEFLLAMATQPGLPVEVGANMGIHTIPLGGALAAQNRKLLVFEPQPIIFQQLCANLALNGLTNVTAWPYACGAENGVVTFPQPDYRRLGNFGAIGMEVLAQASDSPIPPSSVTVPCVRLDDMVEQDTHIGLLKIDVEGFELKVLMGAAATLQRCRPLLYVENDRADRSRDLIEWIWAAGYNLWWHAPRLFNATNHFGVAENLYPGIISLNMLGVPRESTIEVKSMEPILDSAFHPFSRPPEP